MQKKMWGFPSEMKNQIFMVVRIADGVILNSKV